MTTKALFYIVAVILTIFSPWSFADKISPVTKADFSIFISGHSLSIGDQWSEKTLKLAGTEKSNEFVGDVAFGDVNYKFWQHNYPGYSIYSSNFLWDKQQRSVDSYIVVQISLDSAVIVTYRGVKVGDSKNKVVDKYGAGIIDDSEERHSLVYESDDKRIAFQIENGKVSYITLLLKKTE